MIDPHEETLDRIRRETENEEHCIEDLMSRIHEYEQQIAERRSSIEKWEAYKKQIESLGKTPEDSM
jgi:flagellar biosynthesis chaperone FliJ